MPSAIPRLEELTHELEERERDIEASRATLRLIVEAARIGVWDWRMDDGKLYWNGAMRSMWGYCCNGSLNGSCPAGGSTDECDRPEFAGTYELFLAGVVEEDRERVDAMIAKCVAKGLPFSTTYTVRGVDGRERRIDARGNVIYAADKTPYRMVGICIPLDEERTDAKA